MVVVVVVVVVVVDLREDRNINSSNKYLTTLVVHFFHCFVSLNVEQCIKTEFQNFFQEELCMSWRAVTVNFLSESRSVGWADWVAEGVGLKY